MLAGLVFGILLLVLGGYAYMQSPPVPGPGPRAEPPGAYAAFAPVSGRLFTIWSPCPGTGPGGWPWP